MKKRLIKLFAIGSVAVSMMYGIYAYGCADGWWGAGYTSIFSPEITVNNKDYEPFFYDDYTIFYNGYNIQSTTDLFKEETIKDWKNYLEKYDAKTVEYYLYDETLNEILAELSETDTPEKLLNNLVQKQYELDFSRQETKNFLEFILMSRGIESYSNQTYNYWDYDNRIALNADKDFVSHKEQIYNKTSKKDTFYKNRVWFQVVRAKFYSEDRSSVIPFFNETEKNQPKNNLYYQALSYVGGAYKSVKNYEKSNAVFAEVFDKSEPLMPSALFDYRPLGEKEFEKSVKAVSDKSTKEAIYALQGYYTNEFTAMQDLYKLNPQSPHLDFLLSRWVNINEQSINVYTGYEALDIVDTKKTKSTFKSKINHAELKWINSVADNNKVVNPYIWKVASAYFNSLAGDYQKSANQLQQAHQLAKNTDQKAQVRSLRLFNNLLSTDKMDINAESKLIEDVNWLFYDESNVNYWKSSNRITYLQTFTKKYLSSIYKTESNPLMAELTYPINGFYKNQKQSEAMEQLLLSKTKTAWQEIFVGIYPYKLADIYESRGIYLFYQDKIEEAIAEFEKIPTFERREYNWQTKEYEKVTVDYKTQELYGNPFNGKIKDCNDCDHKAKQSVKYSQLSFLKKVKEMQGKIEAGDDVYNNALLVGNAFYNASYFGNARSFYYNDIISEYGNSISNEHEQMLYGMENVKKYYGLAQKHAVDKEQKAKMAYMLAKVERNDFYATTYFIPNDYFYPYGDFVSFKKWKGFVDLKENYSDTKYYQDVITECGYFRKYLGIE